MAFDLQQRDTTLLSCSLEYLIDCLSEFFPAFHRNVLACNRPLVVLELSLDLFVQCGAGVKLSVWYRFNDDDLSEFEVSHDLDQSRRLQLNRKLTIFPKFAVEWPLRRNRSLGGRALERNGVLARRG